MPRARSTASALASPASKQVPIFDRPFLHYQLDLLKRVPEIDEVILSLNYQPRRIEEMFGHGEDTPHIAGRIKQFGKFVMLVPRSLSVTGSAPELAKDIPLPRPRPQDIVAEDVPTGAIGTAAASPKPRP